MAKNIKKTHESHFVCGLLHHYPKDSFTCVSNKMRFRWILVDSTLLQYQWPGEGRGSVGRASRRLPLWRFVVASGGVPAQLFQPVSRASEPCLFEWREVGADWFL